MTDDERNRMIDAFNALGTLDNDCYGNPELGNEHECHCHSCLAAFARQKIRDVLEPPNTSLQENRLCNPAERVFLEHWQKYNERSVGLNGGFTALEHILTPTGGRPEFVSHRDAQVAASVIQWLGTSCGRCFVSACEEKIRTQHVDQRELEPLALTCSLNGEEKTPENEDADFVAGQFFPATQERCRHLRVAIRRCIKRALVRFADKQRAVLSAAEQ